jgi:8-oxo-dGTP diphosphatase
MSKVTPKFGVAVHAVILNHGPQGLEVLLGRRRNTSYGDGQYSFPAGHQEQFETLPQTLCRELKEELGASLVFTALAHRQPVLHIEHLKDYGQSAANRFHHYHEYYFMVPPIILGSFKNNEPDKCDDLRYFPVQQLPENFLPLSRFALNHVLAGQGPEARFGWDNPEFRSPTLQRGPGP